MKIVATIPARLGSERVFQKNLRRMFGEKPMIAYAIEAALGASLIDEVYVNSESDEIGAVGTELGAGFYKRRPELAGSHTTSDEFNYDFMKNVEADLVVLVNPVAPLTTSADIDAMIRHYLESEVDTLLPVKEERMHAFCGPRTKDPDAAGEAGSALPAEPVNFDPAERLARTQDLDPIQTCAWTVCIWRRSTFLAAFEATGSAVFSGRVGFYPQHPYTALKVSTELDFRLAETLLRYDYMWRFPQVPYDSAADGGMPAMWRSEIAYIEGLLLEEAENRDHLEVVEWGSGYSTLHFARFLRERGVSFSWNAVENFVPWHARVEEMLAKAGLGDCARVHLRSPTFEDRKARQENEDLRAFIDFPKSLGHPISVALVDGRRRAECLVSAAQTLEPGGVAILHDAERPALHWAFEHFEGGGRFVVENASPVPGGVQKLWVGRPLGVQAR